MKATYHYDMKGNRVTQDSYNKFGMLFLKANYKFDKEGNEVSMKEYDSHHGLKFSTTYEFEKFDRLGNWLRRITRKNGEVVNITERTLE